MVGEHRPDFSGKIEESILKCRSRLLLQRRRCDLQISEPDVMVLTGTTALKIVGDIRQEQATAMCDDSEVPEHIAEFLDDMPCVA